MQLVLDDRAAALAAATDGALSQEEALAPALEVLTFHIDKFRPLLEALHRDELDGWHLAWVSRQYELFADLLAQYPTLYHRGRIPGYYYQIAANYLFQRRKFLREVR